jgi:hypothetical protein
MVALRPWFAVPAAAAAGASIALAAGCTAEAVVALAALGAALAAAVRAFAGPSTSAAVAGVAGALVGVLGVIELDALVVRGALAGAAAMFAIFELVRPRLPHTSPLPAVGAALVAAIGDPSYVALIALAGVQLVTAPWPRLRGQWSRWTYALPLAGILAIVLAVLAALVWPSLWTVWLGHARQTSHVRALGVRLGDLLGPLTLVAALAGVAICAARGRLAAAAIVAIVAGALLVGLAGGAGASVPIVAGLAAGVAVSRLAAMIQWAPGQTFVAATSGFVLAVALAWNLAARGL